MGYPYPILGQIHIQRSIERNPRGMIAGMETLAVLIFPNQGSDGIAISFRPRPLTRLSGRLIVHDMRRPLLTDFGNFFWEATGNEPDFRGVPQGFFTQTSCLLQMETSAE